MSDPSALLALAQRALSAGTSGSPVPGRTAATEAGTAALTPPGGFATPPTTFRMVPLTGPSPGTPSAGVPPNSPSSDDESDGESVAPGPSAAEPPAAFAQASSVDDEVQGIALHADFDLGPLLVKAIAAARDQHPLRRAYLKNLAVRDPSRADANAVSMMRFYLGSDSVAHFEYLGTLLLRELAAEDENFDPDTSAYDPVRVMAALREILETCVSAPPFHPGFGAPPPPNPAEVAAVAAAAAATAVAGAQSGSAGGAAGAFKKMAIRAVYERLSAFNDRPGAETVFTDADIVNRTLLNALEEALVHNGVFPVDKALAVDRMASLRDRRTGVVNATVDEPEDPSHLELI